MAKLSSPGPSRAPASPSLHPLPCPKSRSATSACRTRALDLGAISRSNSKEREGLPLLTGGEKAHAAQAEAFCVLRRSLRLPLVQCGLD